MAEVTADRWRRINELFHAAAALGREQRARYLEEHATDPTLRREVDSLLAADGAPLAFLDRSAGELLADGPRTPEARRIGAYRLLRPIAASAMSTVFLARRDDGQYRQRVALKLVRRAALSRHLVERFLRERQILADLDHPNVARLLDGGVTRDGSPYLVLEYVDGEPIDRYCKRCKLTVAERLRLFLEVCSAVAHAHRSLVIHRDLKPSNVLVTPGGVPKLLDFGIAKLLAPSAGTAETRATGLQPMTPEYASPEQVRGERVTTASDVYSLGVLLYELLCGAPPYRLAEGTWLELQRLVCHQEPENPSAVAARADLPSGARRRLRNELRGDLDQVARRALRKDPAERYATVEQLSEDLRRHLAGLPVVARRGTWSYRAGKFARRHRVAVTSAALIAASLLAGMAATTWQARKARILQVRAESEQATAQRVTDFLIDLFRASEPGRSGGETVTARELLSRGARRLRLDLGDAPEVRATLFHAIGEVYSNLSLYGEASRHLEEALEIRRRRLGDGAPETLRSRIELAVALWKQGRFGPAEAFLEEAASRARAALGDDHPVTLSALHQLAVLWSRRDRGAEAEPLLRETVARARRRLGEEHPETRLATQHLAQIVAFRGRYRAAESLLLELLAGNLRRHGERHPETLFTRDNLGALYTEEGRYRDAEKMLTAALALRRRLLGDDHRSTLSTLYNLAVLRHSQGRYAAAEALYREGLERASRTLGEDHRLTLVTASQLGALDLERGRSAAAARRLGEVLEDQKAVDGEAHRRTLTTSRHLALAHLAEGRVDAAVALLDAAVATARERADLPPDHQLMGWLLAGLGRALAVSGRLAEAREALSEGRRILLQALGPDHPRSREASRWLASPAAARGAQGQGPQLARTVS